MKSYVFCFHFLQLFPQINVLIYVDIDKGIHYEENKVAENEKGKKAK